MSLRRDCFVRSSERLRSQSFWHRFPGAAAGRRARVLAAGLGLSARAHPGWCCACPTPGRLCRCADAANPLGRSDERTPALERRPGFAREAMGYRMGGGRTEACGVRLEARRLAARWLRPRWAMPASATRNWPPSPKGRPSIPTSELHEAFVALWLEPDEELGQRLWKAWDRWTAPGRRRTRVSQAASTNRWPTLP